MTKRRLPAKLKRLVRQRALGYCEYCLSPEFCATQLHSCEHVTPESKGGTDDAENLAMACQGCNGSKSDKTHVLDPETQKMVPLFHPRRDDWHKHFAWSPDYLHLIGLTPIGRATIHALELNRKGVVRLRRMLILTREHPPDHRS